LRMPISGCCSLSPWTGTMMCLVQKHMPCIKLEHTWCIA
jgi:hypothetical protein